MRLKMQSNSVFSLSESVFKDALDLGALEKRASSFLEKSEAVRLKILLSFLDFKMSHYVKLKNFLSS